jgi:hypothetical protein
VALVFAGQARTERLSDAERRPLCRDDDTRVQRDVKAVTRQRRRHGARRLGSRTAAAAVAPGTLPADAVLRVEAPIVLGEVPPKERCTASVGAERARRGSSGRIEERWRHEPNAVPHGQELSVGNAHVAVVVEVGHPALAFEETLDLRDQQTILRLQFGALRRR